MKLLTFILLITYSLFPNSQYTDQPKPLAIETPAFIDPYAMIREGQELLKDGDLVVRLNRDPTSQFIKNFNRLDKHYSHAGLVLFENGYPFVYHIVNGEENPDEKLRKDSLYRFSNPRKNSAFGIFRYDINHDEIKKLKKLIYAWHKKGIQFDPVFNLKTNDKMYCSEMIMKALSKVTHNRIRIETTILTDTEAELFAVYAHLSFSYTSHLRIVSIDNLYNNLYCNFIKKYSY